jgi:hypothetical protein
MATKPPCIGIPEAYVLFEVELAVLDMITDCGGLNLSKLQPPIVECGGPGREEKMLKPYPKVCNFLSVDGNIVHFELTKSPLAIEVARARRFKKLKTLPPSTPSSSITMHEVAQRIENKIKKIIVY